MNFINHLQKNIIVVQIVMKCRDLKLQMKGLIPISEKKRVVKYKKLKKKKRKTIAYQKPISIHSDLQIEFRKQK